MIINGKAIALSIQNELTLKIKSLDLKRPPTLAFLLIGDHAPSQIYVKHKERTCAEVGIITKGIRLNADISQEEVASCIDQLNKDSEIDGILVQLPLPPQLDTQKIFELIDPTKDVDGFHPYNMGRLLLGHAPLFIPCTPLGVQELLFRSGIMVSHKHIVILGRSNIVGKPLGALLMQKNSRANATVTIVHSHTEDLSFYTKHADIIIAAIGSPEFLKKSMVKKNAIVIDVGINRFHNKLVGDVKFEEVSKICSHITPVPGGVGPMTIAMLMSNTLKSYLYKYA